MGKNFSNLKTSPSKYMKVKCPQIYSTQRDFYCKTLHPRSQKSRTKREFRPHQEKKVYIRSCHVKRESFTSFQIGIHFISYSCLMPCYYLHTMLKRSEKKKGSLFFFLSEIENIQPLTIEYDVSCGLFANVLFSLRKFTSIPSLSTHILQNLLDFVKY